MRLFRASSMIGILFSAAAFGQTLVREAGVPVTDAVVVAKCGGCHARDQAGNMERISLQRTTPEGWQDVVKRMIVIHGASLNPVEARSIVKYLSTFHGLAPEEARPVMYEAERRIREETIPNENVRKTCAQCHSVARALSWRRSQEEWKQFTEAHAQRYKFAVKEEVTTFLTKAAPLLTPEWTAWNKRNSAENAEGRWLVTASLPGRGKYTGELRVEPAGADEFTTSLRLTSVRDGSSIVRSGRSAVYGGYAWRGRSKGDKAPVTADDPSSETREVMWIAPDQQMAEGRWYWGQYQEFGFDVQLRRPGTEPTLLLTEPAALKVGVKGARVRLLGDNLPLEGNLEFGPGVAVQRIISRTASEVVAEVDVAADAPSGRRDVVVRGNRLAGALAIYDRIDYVILTPESAMAAFSDREHPRGYQQFEAIGYQRGADGKAQTADDVSLGPVDATWSMEVFYAVPGSDPETVGRVTASGLFVPATHNPDANFDLWVVATARAETDRNGKPLTAKAYLVVTVPSYVFNGRRFVRDLDRWVDDGPATDPK